MINYQLIKDYIIINKGVIYMSVLTFFLTGVGLSMDAFAISLTKGFCIRRDIIKKSFIISLFFGLFQGIMPLLGWLCGIYFESYIKSIDHWIAFLLLGYLGCKMIYESVKNKENEELECSLEDDKLDLKELTVLSVATSIDALAVGISFAFLSINIIQASLIISITTFIICFLGVSFGKVIGNYIQKYSEILGGIILIGIGIKILIEHLFIS